MLKLLHSIAMKLNALTNFFWYQNCCIWCRCYQMHADDCLDVKKTAFDFERSDALAKLSDCQNCCIWSWNDQMHADGCLLRKFVNQTFFAMKRLLSDCKANKLLIWCQKNCIRFRTIKCTDEIVCWCQKSCIRSRTIKCTDDFVCFIACYRIIRRTSCWLDRNVDSLHLIDLFRWLGYRKLDKAKWIWFVWNVQMRSFDVFSSWKIKFSISFLNDRQ